MTTPADRATALFEQGFNCAQAVFAACTIDSGLDEATALKIASPFGGGVARQGDVCGAVTGALMALGLRAGSSAVDDKEKAVHIAQEFIRRFKARHGTILCREILGYDLSTPKGQSDARASGLFQTACPLAVRTAAEIIVELEA
ncbi:MAG: C_GCAxxG_C_C family protein [Anaerolineales bacterium]|nr:C_GCAxxG_C_C family protein [Anaerolineales bacterium]